MIKSSGRVGTRSSLPPIPPPTQSVWPCATPPSAWAIIAFPVSTLYVTLEPCTMCVGALVHARVARLVFGAREPRAGVVCSQRSALDEGFYNHRVAWDEGVLGEQSGRAFEGFFQAPTPGAGGGWRLRSNRGLNYKAESREFFSMSGKNSRVDTGGSGWFLAMSRQLRIL